MKFKPYLMAALAVTGLGIAACDPNDQVLTDRSVEEINRIDNAELGTNAEVMAAEFRTITPQIAPPLRCGLGTFRVTNAQGQPECAPNCTQGSEFGAVQQSNGGFGCRAICGVGADLRHTGSRYECQAICPASSVRIDEPSISHEVDPIEGIVRFYVSLKGETSLSENDSNAIGGVEIEVSEVNFYLETPNTYDYVEVSLNGSDICQNVSNWAASCASFQEIILPAGYWAASDLLEFSVPLPEDGDASGISLTILGIEASDMASACTASMSGVYRVEIP